MSKFIEYIENLPLQTLTDELKDSIIEAHENELGGNPVPSLNNTV